MQIGIQEQPVKLCVLRILIFLRLNTEMDDLGSFTRLGMEWKIVTMWGLTH